MNLRKVFTVINVTGTWLNLHPHYNVENGKVSTCFFCKISVVLKITCLLVVHIVSLNGRLEFWHKKGSVIINVLNLLLFVVEGGITVLLLWKSAFGNMKDWEKFFSVASKQTGRKSALRKFVLSFFLGQCFPIVLIVINGCIWTNTVGFSTYKYYLVRDVEMYHSYVLCFFYVNLVVSVQNELKGVNNLLSEIAKKMQTDQVDNDQQISFIKLNRSGDGDITQITKTYQNIYEATESINNIFGWEVLFFIGHAACATLKLLYTSVWLADQNVFQDEYKTPLHCMNAVMAISIMVNNAIPIFHYY